MSNLCPARYTDDHPDANHFPRPPDEPKEEPTYCIRRFYAPHMNKESEYMKGEGYEGLSLAMARYHCMQTSTSTSDYFDGYEQE